VLPLPGPGIVATLCAIVFYREIQGARNYLILACAALVDATPGHSGVESSGQIRVRRCGGRMGGLLTLGVLPLCCWLLLFLR